MARVRQVSEREATGAVERVYHELRRTMRVTGVDVSLRTWAAFPRFFVAMWEALGPSVETRAFEESAQGLWARTLEATVGWEVLGAWNAADLGPSQRFHARGILELYEAMQPRVALMVAAVRLALRGEPVGRGGRSGTVERVERGALPRMAAMEWAPERPPDARLRALYSDIVKRVGHPGVPGEYRALACWPEYLEAVWSRLGPVMRDEAYARATEGLRAVMRQKARDLPFEVALSRQRVTSLGEDADAVLRLTDALEERLPGLLVNLALMVQDVPDILRQPIPGAARLVPDWVAAKELR
ncbi:halocarboxylic acid dehydrogenase DehI family protein [Myxococcus sp. K15C18031901]|uniref:halocarboxylic acid dehydrogenase DehI family protein n=1 Tax=Myxococcus dinghuensis TaxID=2906761 RepID=UPI0020A823B2|nr:halocarboxylic acid dehydrogenase DehI family protein [Myxococcus dinghuensis]MCP3099305.1 halocarboxylic acid dehydrogenase DehI family protein [Myxococcus dinghuensis]